MLKQIINKFIKNNKGFFLVDSMVGVLILAIGLTGLATLYTQGTNVSFKSDKMQAAVQVAGQEMERIKKIEKANEGKGIEDFKNEIAKINSETSGDDGKYVAMRGYTPNNAKSEDKYIITTTLTAATVGGKVPKGSMVNYPISVKVTWKDPSPGSYTLNGYVMAVKVTEEEG